MQNSERFVGMGLAMVDEKVRKPGLILPPSEQLARFLDTQVDPIRETGGVTPNIISALTTFSPDNKTRLLACTGADNRGKFYQSRTHSRLGPLQINPELPTGVVVSVIDNEGIVYQRGRNLGAAEKVTVGKEETEEKTALFLSDLTSLRLPHMFTEADKMLASLHGGNFFLNLAGLNPAIAPRDEVVSALTALRKTPDIVTGNENEFAYLTGTDNVAETAMQTFPDARLLVLTRADQGSQVRFEGETFFVPPYPVPPDDVVDETGAGDTYAGIMLGALYTKPYSEWTKKHVLQACRTAAFGASLAVQTIQSRLTAEEMGAVNNYHLTRTLQQ